MRLEQYRAKDLIKLFRKNKIATMDELKEMLGTQADATIFRKLRELPYRTSYSHRGRYYTLDDMADYDEWGLWSYREVWFSLRGSLMATADTPSLIARTRLPISRSQTFSSLCSARSSRSVTFAFTFPSTRASSIALRDGFAPWMG